MFDFYLGFPRVHVQSLAYDSSIPIVRVVSVAVVVGVITAIAGFSNWRMVALGESQLVSKTKDIVQEDWSSIVCPPQQ